MNKIIISALLSTISSIPFQGFAAAEGGASRSIAEVYERAKTHSSGSLSRGAALRELRAQKAISDEDYRHVKGSSASQAALVRDLHNMGIQGQDVTVWLLEDSGINRHADVEKYVDPSSDMAPAAGFDQKQDHGAAMASLSHQLAPKAKLVVKHSRGYVGPLRDSLRTPLQPDIINASFNVGDEVIQEYFGPIFELKRGFRPLVVKSAGNDAKILSENPQYAGITAEVLQHLVIAGNLRQDGRPRASSGVPGENKEIQNRFLWVIADDMLAAGGPTASNGYRYITGTSGAAAILSGAAAIIKGRYPHFTMADVAECLLESANRDLFGLFGDGYHAVHVVDGPVEILHEPVVGGGEEGGEAASAVGAGAVRKSPIQVRTIRYNPAQWGKGVLNVKNALLYADLKARSPRAKPEDLRNRMLRLIAAEQEDAAKLIQRWWRAHKRTVPEHEKPLPLVVDPRIRDREYPEAEGRYRGPSIPEPSPYEAGRAEGMHYEGTGTGTKGAAAIREERQKAIDSRKSVVDHLKTGTKTLRDVFTEIKDLSFEDFMTWVTNNPGILRYTIEGKSFLEQLIDSHEAQSLSQRLLIKAFSPYREENLPIIIDIIEALLRINYIMYVKEPLVAFIENILRIKEKLPEGFAIRLLKKQIIGSYGEDSVRYGQLYLEQDLSPTEDLGDRNTIFHAVATGNPDFFDRTLRHYVAKGHSARALLEQPNGRGTTPYAIYIEQLGFREVDAEARIRPFLDMGLAIEDRMFHEMRSAVRTFISMGRDAGKTVEGKFYYKDLETIRKNFLALKNNAFILEIPGISKSFDKVNPYDIPEPVEAYLRDNYDPATITADGWQKLIDDAWVVYERFLEANADATHEVEIGFEGEKEQRPVKEVDGDGTVFFYTMYREWVPAS